MGATLLSGHCAVRSHQLDEMQGEVANVFCQHGLALDRGERELDARLNSVQLGSVGLHFLEYGVGVRISPIEFEYFFLVQIPLRGSARIRTGNNEFISDRQRASVPDPNESLEMSWGRGNAQLIVWLDRPALEGTLRQMIGEELNGPLRFDPEMRLTDSGPQAWISTVRFLVDDLNGRSLSTANPVAQRHMEGLVMSQLLLTHGHSYRDRLDLPAPAATPKVIRKAQEIIDDHAAEPLSVHDIAEAVGVSIRCLQEGFRRYLGTSPTRYLRQARLARAHAMLTHAQPGSVSVADVATACGFAHLGRFATEYRRRYGASPSATLRG